MSMESLFVILLVGAAAGWLAGQIVRGFGYGLLGNIVIGIIGAFVASWLFPRLDLNLSTGNPIVDAILAATIGAVLLLFVIRLVKRRLASNDIGPEGQTLQSRYAQQAAPPAHPPCDSLRISLASPCEAPAHPHVTAVNMQGSCTCGVRSTMKCW